ncbi:MAG: hypothetical protein IT320_19625 [Anaerolineae bacterium]|nr:hypothetical protein [Anaerolineae bacterium]
MSYRKPLVLTLLLLFALALLPTSALAQDDMAAASSGYRPDAPAYGVRGPHAVGARSLEIDADGPLALTMWYPALNDAGAEEAITYDYEVKFAEMVDVPVTIAGHAISDAPYELAETPYPLVVLSPGLALGSTTYAWMAEHLASYGFVVVSPEHREVISMAAPELWQPPIHRPQEVIAVLDYVEVQAEAGGDLEGLTNTETVAVIGHSYGGYTTLAMAGARYDFAAFEELCAPAREAGDESAWLCDALLPFAPDMAELAGLDGVPEGLWPSMGDERVDAIVPMAGDAFFFNEAGLAEITVPVMAIGGTADTGTPYMWGTYPTYEDVSSETKVRVGLENGEHMIFGSSCEALPFFAEIGFYSFCSDPVWDMDRAHDLINHFTTAFLLAELKDDAGAAAALAPDAAQFVGVDYDAQGF